jgi:hypothetical protein
MSKDAVKHYQRFEREAYLLAQVRDRKLSQIEVDVRGLEFHECYGWLSGGREFDLAPVNATLTVYYYIDYSDSEGPQLYVEHIVTFSPLLFVGELCDHIIGAAVDLMPNLCESRKLAIIEDAEELIVAQEREAA